MDSKKIGKRLKLLREYNGLSHREFGILFLSEESTVRQWEYGYCVPRLVKLMNISAYFGVSLDCILCGKALSGNALEQMLCEGEKIIGFQGPGRVMRQYNALSSRRKERLAGYLDALCRENRM
jgi:transcriptional regulator with XRE-family HTH domain